MTVKIDEKKLKLLMKESVREVMRAEIMQFRAFVLPEISEKEQKDIEKRYVNPSRKACKEYELKI